MGQKRIENQQRYEKIGKNYTGFQAVFIQTVSHRLSVTQSSLFAKHR